MMIKSGIMGMGARISLMLAFAFVWEAALSLTVTMDRPSEGATIGGQAMVRFTVNGGTGATSWKVILDKNLGTSRTLLTGSGNVANQVVYVDVSTVSNGQHTLVIEATDESETVVSDPPMNVVVDNTSFIALTAPKEGDILSGTTQITGKSGGDWTITVQNQTFPAVPPGSPGDIDLSWDTTGIPDGVYVLRLSVTNLYNINELNESRLSRNIVIDHTAPTIELKKPEAFDGAYFVRGNAVAIQATIEDENPDKWEVTINNTAQGLSAKEGTGANINITWNSTLYPQGVHTLRIKATDKAGNTFTLEKEITVDNQGPLVVLTKPELDTYVPGGSVEIWGQVLETNPNSALGAPESLKQWRLTVDNSPAGIDTPTGTTNVNPAGKLATWDSTTFEEGSHTITLTGEDKAGNTRSVSRTVNLDKTAPRIELTKPIPGNFARGIVRVEGTITEDKLDYWEAYVDTSDRYTGVNPRRGTTSSIGIDWNSATYAQGEHTFYIKAVDKAGNEKTESFTRIVDNIPPVVSITYPLANDVFTNTVAIQGTATDALVGGNNYFKEWRLYVDDILIANGATPVPTNALIYTWEVGSDWSNGNHVLKLVGEDEAGAESSTSVTIILDKAAPKITFNNPVENGPVPEVHGVFNIRATIEDASPVTWEIALRDKNGTPYDVDWTGDTKNVSVNWYTSQKTNVGADKFRDNLSPYTITLVATDSHGNQSLPKSVQVIVDNQVPYIELDEDSPLDKAWYVGMVPIKGSVYLFEGSLVLDANASWNIRIDNQDIQSGTNGIIDAQWDSTTASSGEHTITVTATDKAGNSTTRTRTIIRDKDKPSSNIVFPARNGIIRANAKVTVVVDINDNNFVEDNSPLNTVELNGVAVQVIIPGQAPLNVVGEKLEVRSANQARWTGSFTCRVPGLFRTNRKYKMQVIVTDKSNNKSVPATVEFTVRFR